MSAGREFALSVEELVLSLFLAGRAEAAAGVIEMNWGKLAEQELQVRLLAAGHSLAARELLHVDVHARTKELLPELQAVVVVLVEPDVSLRLSRQVKGRDHALALHASQGQIIAHAVEQGVVHRLEVIQGLEGALEKADAFLALNESAHTEPDEQQPEEEVAQVQAGLLESGLPEPHNEWFAEDAQSSAGWCSLTRIAYTDQHQPYADQRTLLLKGPERFWVVSQPEQEEDGLAIEFGSKEALQRELAKQMSLTSNVQHV